MSLEHIWPQSLGGSVSPAIFQTRDVCATCNGRMGLWVDASFTKSWFISMERSISAHDFLNAQKPEVYPLIYYGFDQQIPLSDGWVCERWGGLAGEHIYHVHRSDEERWETYAGGDVLKRKQKDPGRIYFFLTADHGFWWVSAILSIVSRFPSAMRR